VENKQKGIFFEGGVVVKNSAEILVDTDATELRGIAHGTGIGEAAAIFIALQQLGQAVVGVVDGKAKPDANVRILRDNVVVYEGKLSSLKRFQDDAKEVVAGQECGLGIENFNDIKEGDIVESYTMEEVKRTLR